MYVHKWTKRRCVQVFPAYLRLLSIPGSPQSGDTRGKLGHVAKILNNRGLRRNTVARVLKDLQGLAAGLSLCHRMLGINYTEALGKLSPQSASICKRLIEGLKRACKGALQALFRPLLPCKRTTTRTHQPFIMAMDWQPQSLLTGYVGSCKLRKGEALAGS